MSIRASRVREYYEYPRPDVAVLLPAGAERILDVGCGAGELGRALKSRRPRVELVGVERNEEAAGRAREIYDEVIVGDVENCPALADLGGFDCIVLADLLEHTADPARLLERLKGLLRPDGRLIVSVPNVSHYSVILGLLRDRWRYADRGILDRGHLRFFTRRSFAALARSRGWRVMRHRANYRLLERRGLRYDRFIALPLTLYFARHLFVFQNLFVLAHA